MGFRQQGSKDVPAGTREVFLAALGSGLSRSAAATIASVSHRLQFGWLDLPEM